MFLVGETFSAVGFWVQIFAATWLILDLTHSAVAVGVFALCQFLPFTFFGLFVGAIIDRFDPHRMVVATQTLLCGISVTLAALTLSGVIATWQIYVLSIAAGCVSVLDAPARQALTFAIVGRAGLSNAVGLNTTVYSAGRVLGPATAGVLVATIGIGGCFVVNVISFLPVLGALLALRRSDLLPGTRGEAVHPNMLRGTGDALVYVLKTPTVAVILGATFMLSTLSSNVNVLVPLLARQTFARRA